MQKESEEFEKIKRKIPALVKELFEVKKRDDYKTCADYERLERQIPAWIWKYTEIMFAGTLCKKDRAFLGEFWIQVSGFAKRFVENGDLSFSCDEKIFNYFLKSIKLELASAENKVRKEEESGGVRISRNKTDDSADRFYGEILKMCENAGKDIRKKEVQEWLSLVKRKPHEEIRYAVESHSISVQSEWILQNDGGEISVFERDALSSGVTPYNAELEENYKKLFAEFERVYKSKRPQMKKDGFLSKVVTCHLLEDVIEKKLKSAARPLIQSLLLSDEYEFADESLLRKWAAGEELPLQQEICKDCGRDESKASKALTDFKEIFAGKESALEKSDSYFFQVSQG